MKHGGHIVYSNKTALQNMVKNFRQYSNTIKSEHKNTS